MEDAMPKQRHEARSESPLTSVFAALIDVAARGRWGGDAIVPGTPQPRVGCQYAQQRGKVFRRGKVLGCQRPVSMTLQETLLDPPCCVKLRLHWRVEPLENGSCVLLDARYSLNGAASLRRKHWHERLHGHCTRMLANVQRLAADPERPPQTSLSVAPAESQVSHDSRTLLAAPRI
jgi:hypothetical protein